MRLDHDDYIGRDWKKFEDTYGNYIYDQLGQVYIRQGSQKYVIR